MNIPAPPDSPSLKILLVDDEEIVLKATCDYLVTCFGFDVDITESGELDHGSCQCVQFFWRCYKNPGT